MIGLDPPLTRSLSAGITCGPIMKLTSSGPKYKSEVIRCHPTILSVHTPDHPLFKILVKLQKLPKNPKKKTVQISGSGINN